MSDDSAILEEIGRLRGNLRQQRTHCDRMLAGAEPIGRKARWAYSHFLARTGQSSEVSQAFVRAYLRAWRDSLLYVVNGPGRLQMIFPPDLRNTILACWHFPEHTALLHRVAEANALVLVAKEQSWMSDLRRLGCLYCFRDAPSLVLPRAMRAGRPIFAMMDFCYPETHHTVADFLSYPSRTPSGLLQLAAFYKYTLRVISIRSNTLQCVSDIPTEDRSEQAIAHDVNRAIEAEILRRPERWLMWPSVDRRWIGVDYS